MNGSLDRIKRDEYDNTRNKHLSKSLLKQKGHLSERDDRSSVYKMKHSMSSFGLLNDKSVRYNEELARKLGYEWKNIYRAVMQSDVL